MKMDKKSLVFSTVALSAVMLSASIGVTSDVQAAETSYTISMDANGDDNVPYESDDFYSSMMKPIVTSYKEKIDLVEGDTLRLSDLKVKCDRGIVESFSDGSSVKKFTSTGTFEEKVIVSNCGYTIELPVTVYVQEAKAPTIHGVHNVTVLSIQLDGAFVEGNSRYGKDDVGINYSKYVMDPETKSVCKLKEALSNGVYAVDCRGRRIDSDNIKITGYSVKQKNWGQTQTVAYTVTDDAGRTSSKTCKLFIDDGIKKVDKYMYVSVSGYLSESPFTNYVKKGHTAVKVPFGTKVHVVGIFKPTSKVNYTLHVVEYNGKNYYYANLVDKINKDDYVTKKKKVGEMPNGTPLYEIVKRAHPKDCGMFCDELFISITGANVTSYVDCNASDKLCKYFLGIKSEGTSTGLGGTISKGKYDSKKSFEENARATHKIVTYKLKK